MHSVSTWTMAIGRGEKKTCRLHSKPGNDRKVTTEKTENMDSSPTPGGFLYNKPRMMLNGNGFAQVFQCPSYLGIDGLYTDV
jgi:hypothetical protein